MPPGDGSSPPSGSPPRPAGRSQLPSVRALVALVLVLAATLIAAGCGSSSVREQAVDDGPALESVRIEITDPATDGDVTGTGGGQSANDVAATGGTEAAGSEGDNTVVGDDGPAAYTVVARAVVPEVTARTSPDLDAPPVAAFSNPISSGAPLVFRSVDTPADTPDWLQVQLPIEPNGTTGWILRSDVELFDNPYRIEIDRATYSLKVFERNELWLETLIAVGNGATPTPVGEFYLLELLAPPQANGPYGPYAFGLSGFSEVLSSFGGADVAIIGIHGTNDPSSLGTEVSHGCIRLENAVIERLASTLPLGTPVSIT